MTLPPLSASMAHLKSNNNNNNTFDATTTANNNSAFMSNGTASPIMSHVPGIEVDDLYWLLQNIDSNDISNNNKTASSERPFNAFSNHHFISQPTPQDVLLGRGRAHDLHPGNMYYKALVEFHNQHYNSNCINNNASSNSLSNSSNNNNTETKLTRGTIVLGIIQAIQETGGKFLVAANDSSDSAWKVLSSSKTKIKVSQALRFKQRKTTSTNTTATSAACISNYKRSTKFISNNNSNNSSNSANAVALSNNPPPTTTTMIDFKGLSPLAHVPRLVSNETQAISNNVKTDTSNTQRCSSYSNRNYRLVSTDPLYEPISDITPITTTLEDNGHFYNGTSDNAGKLNNCIEFDFLPDFAELDWENLGY